MTQCFIALGSNLRSPERQLAKALHALHCIPRTQIIKASAIHYTIPLGQAFQPTYCNQVIELFTRLPPLKLLRYCQFIELKHKRVRKRKWGPRTLDIDILLYGNTVINHDNLIIPHPEMLNRDFVLNPLVEIAPDLLYIRARRSSSRQTFTSQMILP